MAVPAATLIAADLTPLAPFGGLFVVNETISDSAPNAVPNPVTWNTQSPLNTVDFSFFTVAASTTLERSNGSGCVKISPHCGLIAEHAPGNRYYFMKADGTEIVVDRAQKIDIDINADLSLAVFSSPISDADIPPIALLTQASYDSLIGRQCLAFEADRHLNLHVLNAPDPITPYWTIIRRDDQDDLIEGGDSGKPVIVLNGHRPLLLMSAFYGESQSSPPPKSYGIGPNPSHFLSQIQAEVEAFGDTVTLVELAYDGSNTAPPAGGSPIMYNPAIYEM